MKNKKAFTLIEMLIVIVIVGILASALVPKLVGVQERARDVARSTELQQIASAIMTYELDNGEYPNPTDVNPTTGGHISEISDELLGTYLKSIPKDPKAGATIPGCRNLKTFPGEYLRMPLKRRGTDGGAFAMVAAVEQISMANFVSVKNGTNRDCPVDNTKDIADITLCERITTLGGTATATAGECDYNPANSDNQLLLLILN